LEGGDSDSGLHDKCEEIIQYALKIIKLAESQGISMRLLGGCAIRYHCPCCEEILRKANRRYADIDFITIRSKVNEKRLKSFFKQLDFTPDERFITLYGDMRHIYYNNNGGPMVEVFFDKLVFNHEIDLRDRFFADYPTIPVADLFLEKAQIVKITEKDLIDMAALLIAHEIDGKDGDVINIDYIADVLSKDWGFYYTVTTNLNKLRDYVQQSNLFTEHEKHVVTQKVSQMIAKIEEKPKSMKWKMRAAIGTKKPWYNEVEEKIR